VPASRFETTQRYPCLPTFSVNSFRLIHFRKNVSANPLVSHTFRTKDLKPFSFIHFQKKVGVGSRISCFEFRVSSPNSRLSTADCQLSPVTPLDSALTSKRGPKSFASNTYEKHTRGEGGLLAQPPLPHSRPLPPLLHPRPALVLDLHAQPFRSSCDPL
jgi:hypothetical protein